MELRQLEYAKAVALAGSFTAAAKTAGIAEPGLHKQVRKLEAELGVSLFERSGRGIRTTSAGIRLLESVEEVLSSIRQMKIVADDMRDGNIGIINIGCYPAHVVRFLANAIVGFEKEHPGLFVRLGQHSGDQVLEGRQNLYDSLFQGQVDLIVGPLQPAGIESLKAYTVRIAVIVPDDHPLRDREKVDVTALQNERLVCLPRGMWFRARLIDACEAAGFHPRIEVETTVEPLISLALEGYGIGLMGDDNLSSRYQDRPYPVLTDQNGSDMAVINWLQWRQDVELSPPALAFIKYMKKIT